MNNQVLFDFKTDISKLKISSELNNPFGLYIPEIARIAANEFQQFISAASKVWSSDFLVQKGKMFGILVVQKKDHSYCFLAAVSGKTPGNALCVNLIPSIFDDSVDDFFINKGMLELTQISHRIKESNIQSEIINLTDLRKQKSLALQQQLFENYRFLNLFGEEKNLLEIFRNATSGNPPSAAGECAAPKLLHYAFKHQLKPMAIAEFWLGNISKNNERKHQVFYPACKNKCLPILEYMLGNTELYNQVNLVSTKG